MQFFKLNNILADVGSSNVKIYGIGILIDDFIKIEKKLAKINPTLSMQHLENIVIIENLILNNQQDYLFVELKKSTALNISAFIVEKFKVFELKVGENSLFGTIFNNELTISKNEQQLKSEMADFLNGKGISVDDKKAFDWLNSKDIGMSSLTLCYNMFPGLRGKHNELNGNSISHPHDPSDFKRCDIFLQATDRTPKDIADLNLSKSWHELAKNWHEIQLMIDNNQKLEAYNLIKSCVNEGKTNKPRF